MARMRCRAFECLALVALVGLLEGTLSAEPKVGVALDYQVHAGCPNADELLAEIMARTPRAKAAVAGEDALSLRVRIDEVPGGSRGELVIGRASDGSTSRRELAAADCRQVVSALALMTALVIDPDAATSLEPPPPKPPPPRPAAAPPPPPPPPGPKLSHFVVHAGLGVELNSAITPELALAGLGFVELTRVERGLGYEARLSLLYARHTVEADAGAGSLTLTRGRLDACLRHPVVAPPLWVAGCGAFEGGVLAASGRGITPVASETRPWLAGGPAVRLELVPTPHLRLEAAGNVLFPLVRDRFYLYENATLRETPPVTFGLAVALSAAF
ncbi:MAG TPA: hypothetical protein VNN72_05790 [Polyangiaceae bacterium]|nr:hypothetical protein [Polyangiaceae bacterium]